MAEILPRLTPFWFTPPDQETDPGKFKLRPLSQPQVVDMFSHYDVLPNGDQVPGGRTFYEAGRVGIVDLDGFTDPDTGKAVGWPSSLDRLPFKLIQDCGRKLLYDAWGVAADEPSTESGELALPEGMEPEAAAALKDPLKN